MLEVYNENMYDLLSENLIAVSDSNKIKLRKTKDGTEVEGVTCIVVQCATEVKEVFARGNRARSVGATKMNIESSRSHMVCWLTISSTDLATGNIAKSSLYLVDLAGSERLSKSDASGTRLKETQHINK